MRLFFRLLLGLLGVVLLIAALWPAAREAMALAAGAHAFIPLGQLWFEIDPPSLNMTRLSELVDSHRPVTPPKA